ncbi:hypothetical protein BD626DRAFT_574888 [Schizophyllum amplum]|uniref:Uncharacterized protein n=1 Tax=Schizophyllum amplum TaxID=97359 RepID=A0A550BX00_9AGAR|nr:hypothetical protein BD626DRAFT_574888 [Auriculariopsis ampla]
MTGTHGLDHAYKVLQAMSSDPLRLRELQHYDLSSADCWSSDSGHRGSSTPSAFFRLLRDRLDPPHAHHAPVAAGMSPLTSSSRDLRAFPNVSTMHRVLQPRGCRRRWRGRRAHRDVARDCGTSAFANREADGMSRVTLAGLVPIDATRCPELEDLTFPLSVRQVPEPVQLEDHEVLRITKC